MSRLGKAATAILIVVIALAVPIGVGMLAAKSAAGNIYPDVHIELPEHLPTPPFDPAKPTVAIVVGGNGANIADTLAPFETLAVSGVVNVYTVAPRRGPITLTGGLQLVPDFDFAGLARLIPGGPDAVIVPALSGAGSAATRDVEQWLVAQRANHRSVLASICVGAELLASAGILDGRPATSHWLGLIGLRRNYPAVDWQGGQRYIDDGDVITGAGVLSGIDVALRLIERFDAAPAARRAAVAVSWPSYTPMRAAMFTQSGLSAADAPALLSATFRWDRPRIGVALTDGVGEIEIASAFRPYTELSYLADLTPLSLGERVIRSRHGMTFVINAAADAAVDRVIVPGVDAAEGQVAKGLEQRTSVTYLHERAGFAFDGALRDIASTYDVASARWVAKSLQYPPTELDLSGDRWPWALTLRPLLIIIVIVACGLLIRQMVVASRAAK